MIRMIRAKNYETVSKSVKVMPMRATYVALLSRPTLYCLFMNINRHIVLF